MPCYCCVCSAAPPLGPAQQMYTAKTAHVRLVCAPPAEQGHRPHPAGPQCLGRIAYQAEPAARRAVVHNALHVLASMAGQYTCIRQDLVRFLLCQVQHPLLFVHGCIASCTIQMTPAGQGQLAPAAPRTFRAHAHICTELAATWLSRGPAGWRLHAASDKLPGSPAHSRGQASWSTRV